MPYPIPTIPELRDRIAADFETRIPGADARVRRSFLGVITFVLAAGFYALYGFISWLVRQVFVDTAEAELLDRHAGIYGITRDAAVAAQFQVTITGTNGTLIPAGTRLSRADREEFTTNADATISAGTATVVVTAVTAGEDGNTTAGTSLSFVSPISGAETAAATSTVVVTGADEQDDDDLRAEVLARIQNPPQGGAAHDYVAWAKQVAGVTRAWASSPDEGEVLVYFVRDDDGTGSAIIPSGAEVTEVFDYIDALRPVALRNFSVAAPSAVLDAFTIHISPDTTDIRAAVQAELDDLYRRNAEPGATMLLSQIREAVSRAAGENDNSVTVPAANITHMSSQMPIRGTITWV